MWNVLQMYPFFITFPWLFAFKVHPQKNDHYYYRITSILAISWRIVSRYFLDINEFHISSNHGRN